MMAVHVSNHAVLRYQQRVAMVPIDEARAALSSPVIEQAAIFAHNASCEVRLPTGHRLVIRDHCVITVKPKPLRRRCRK